MGRRLSALVIAFVIGAVTLAGCDDPEHRIRYAMSADRSNAQALDGAKVNSPIYVFYDSKYASETARVTFLVDLHPTSTEQDVPYDLNGGSVATANPYDPRPLGSGEHLITVVVDRTDDKRSVFTATFTVGSAPSSSTPTTTTATTSTTQPAATRTLSGQITLDSLTIPAGQTVQLDPNANTLVQLTGNLIVQGRLVMKPANAGIRHTVRFVGIDESKVVGGGMDPIATDVGLWVMGSGQLDIAGAPKTAWTHLAGSAGAGSGTVALAATPSGWRVGDEISVAPTQANDYRGFDTATITSISGNTVTLDRALQYPHPKVGDRWTAEVMNLTRNVNIEGTGNGTLDPTFNGRAHVFVRSTQPQSIKYVTIRHVGPRPAHISTQRPIGAEQKFPSPMDTTGRYGLHLHHNMDGSRGTLVEGVVVRDSGNHAFVPHMSNGITFRGTISYNTTHDAYWWDGPTCPPPCNLQNFRQYQREADPTNDVLFDNAIAAKVNSGSNVWRLSGFELGRGANNVVRNSVAVGVQDAGQSNGFEWPEAAEGSWTVVNDVAHNNAKSGMLGWQNTVTIHAVNGFTAYHNLIGIDHGAYTNDYLFRGGTLYGNSRTGILLEAVSKSSALLRFQSIVIDGGGVGVSAIETTSHRASRLNPTLFEDVTMRGFSGRSAVLFNTGGDFTDRIDFINPTFTGNEFYVQKMVSGSRVRVQTGTSAYELTPTSQPGAVWAPNWNAYKTTIGPFG